MGPSPTPPNQTIPLDRALLGSALATAAGWTASILFPLSYAIPHLKDPDLDWPTLALFIGLSLISSAIFVFILWGVVLLPLYLFIPRQSIFWRWPICTATGMIVGATIAGCFYWETLGDSAFSIARAACTCGVACLVAGLTSPRFHHDVSPDGRLIVKIWLSAGIFLAAIPATSMVCIDLWDALLNGKVYGCSDGGSWDYWIRDWATIGNGSYPAVTVKKINIQSMSDPDQLKEGWTVARLWTLWYTFLTGSILASLLLSSLPWWKRMAASVVNRSESVTQ
jgi:hypothetical protein